MNQQQFKFLKEQSPNHQVTILDDKGFTIYQSQKLKQNDQTTKNNHHFYELYQLTKYFFTQENHQYSESQPIVGIQTDKSLTLIKKQSTSQQEENIVVLREKLQKTGQKQTSPTQQKPME